MAKKTVLITGSTRGIGLALVEYYVAKGWNVIGTARNLNSVDKLKALAPYKIVQLDAGDEASILNAAKELQGEPIDLLINNAGIVEGSDLTTTTKAELMHQFEVNAVGPLRVTQAFTPNLQLAVSRNGSALVAQVSTGLGSISFHSGSFFFPGIPVPPGIQPGYSASKAALNMFNAHLAIHLKKDKIVSIVIHPGLVATDMNPDVKADGVIQPSESAEGMAKVFNGLSIEDTGKFYSYDGTTIDW